MATSDVEICNLALDAVGGRSSIASLSETSTEARACARQYRACRDSVLGAAHWNFARKQGAIALLKDGSLTPPDDVPQPWRYEYSYPTDCLRARYLMPTIDTSGFDGQPVSMDPPNRFIVSSDVDSDGVPNKVLLTNTPQAILVYTMRLENPALYDEDFTTALSYYLGAKLVMTLTGDKTLARALFDTADRMTRDARTSNGNEGGPTQIDIVPDWIAVRGYEADAGYPYMPYVMPPLNLSFIA